MGRHWSHHHLFIFKDSRYIFKQKQPCGFEFVFLVYVVCKVLDHSCLSAAISKSQEHRLKEQHEQTFHIRVQRVPWKEILGRFCVKAACAIFIHRGYQRFEAYMQARPRHNWIASHVDQRNLWSSLKQPCGIKMWQLPIPFWRLANAYFRATGVVEVDWRMVPVSCLWNRRQLWRLCAQCLCGGEYSNRPVVPSVAVQN